MSFSFNGAASARIFRNSGNVSNTNAFTQTGWVKRTTNPSGLKFIWTYRSDTDGHDLVLNDPGQTANKLDLQANFATAQAVAIDPLALNTWTFVAVVGSGANISLKYWDGSAIVTATVGQTAFVPTIFHVGDSGSSTNNFTGLIAHLRSWNAALSDAELIAEKNSATRVRTTNHLSSHSGDTDISTALAGEVGTAFTNAGEVTFSSDTPSFNSFTGVTISGSADMPSYVAPSTTSRVNRILHSGALSNPVWSLQGNELVAGAASIAAGYGSPQRCTIKVTTGGIYQKLIALPSGKSTAVMAFKRVDSDYVVFRHMLDGFGSGAQGFFNLLTGAWAGTSIFGTISEGAFGSYNIGGGWYLIYIAMTAGGDRIVEFYPCATNTTQTPALNKSIDVAAAQYEDATTDGIVKATYHKPTTTAVVVRNLTSATMTLAASSIGVSQTTTATAQLLDEAGAPWDQATVDTFTSSDTGKATIPPLGTSNQTDRSGRLSVTVSGVAVGTTNIAATSGSVTAPSKTLTVSGTAIGNWVRIFVEAGWQGTSGWFVGVYVKHPTGRFPTAFLFEASGQRFMTNLAPNNGQSFMDVAVPAGVSVTLGQVVEVALENDDVSGKAVDGPGIFSATVI